MLLVMGVSLYTSRVVLKTLGVEDFGIYNVVGGIVTMFSFLNGAMTTGSQRFFSFELGKKDYLQLQRVFSMSVTIHLYIAIIILILSETVGLWFLNTQLNIPQNRIIAANWVYQFSILSFVVSIISVPYNALIVAHEKMNIYAYVSILEVLLKLGVVYLLLLFGYDKLTLYALLIFCVALLLFFVFKGYTNKTFKESRYTYFTDKDLFKTLTGFAGWSLFGSIAGILNTQGINILLNIFFGPVLNAARGLAVQVQMALNQFVISISQASNPQIIKYHSTGDVSKVLDLVFNISKYSFFILLVLTSSLIFETNFFMKIWLEAVPPNLIDFVRILIIVSLIDSISLPLMTLVQANGKIKRYQIVVGGIQIFVLPIVLLLFYAGFQAIIAFYILIFFSIITLFLRLIFLKKLVDFPILLFFKKVLLKILVVCILGFALLNFIFYYLSITNEFFLVLIKCSISIFVFLFLIYIFGIDNTHKKIIISKFIINKK